MKTEMLLTVPRLGCLSFCKLHTNNPYLDMVLLLFANQAVVEQGFMEGRFTFRQITVIAHIMSCQPISVAMLIDISPTLSISL